MENEKAISLLKTIKINSNGEFEVLGNWYRGIDNDYMQALEMAINALEERPQGGECMENEYIVGDADHNVKVAVDKLREAYWSNDYEKYASQYKQAEDIIISAICHSGYTLIRQN